MEDSQIVLLLRNKPSDGLYEAIKKYRGFVAAVTGRILNQNKQDIEECIDDTFVTVWKNINQTDCQIMNLKGYIACIARNTAINRYRELVQRKVVCIDDIEVASDIDVMLELEDKGNASALQQLVIQMDEPDREIFVRKYFLFQRIKEIARLTELDETQVKNRLYRGKHRLRKQLEERNVAL